MPYTVSIDPRLGQVGLSAAEARAQGRPIRVAQTPMSYVPRALEPGESRGFMKAVVDADTSQILGCAILGLEGGEIMAMLQIAMMGRLPYTDLRDGTFAHPTLAEALNNLFPNFVEWGRKLCAQPDALSRRPRANAPLALRPARRRP